MVPSSSAASCFIGVASRSNPVGASSKVSSSWVVAGGGAGGCGDGTIGGVFLCGVAVERPGNSVLMKRACGDT
eukprot:1633580-Pleurochrysis_carterae.AAC.1